MQTQIQTGPSDANLLADICTNAGVSFGPVRCSSATDLLLRPRHAPAAVIGAIDREAGVPLENNTR
jgi:hypothetical protein